MTIQAQIDRIDQQLGSLLSHPFLAAVLNNPAAEVGDVYIASLSADKIVAGSGIINNLTINAVLTLGAGGSIVDGDGSTWDQSGITLKSTGSVGDAIIISRDTSTSKAKIQASIGASPNDFVQTWFRASEDPSDVTKYQAFLNLFAGDPYGLGASALFTLGLGLPYPASSPTTFIFAGIEVTPSSLDDEVGWLQLGAQATMNVSVNRGVEDANMGKGTVHIGNAVTTPTGNPGGGGFLYAEGGALKWRGSGGTTTTVAPS